VGEIDDCINSLTEVRAHKDWSLESDPTMSDEDRKLTPRELQDTMNLDPEVEDNESGSNGDFDHDVNTAIATPEDVDSVEEEGSITLEVYGWSYSDLTQTNRTNVGLVMDNWELHEWRYFCYNCNKQLLYDSLFSSWSCPLCESLEMSRTEGEVCWNLGECTHCYNVGPDRMKCLTCLLDDGNMETWKAVKITL
jgi:predicted RNA-binding Zn-ribbon protein involved in translation (DUF1610 family)